MTEAEIAERLILALEIEEAASNYIGGPKKPRSLALPYTHDWTDKNGWGSERHKEEEKAFRESIARQPTPQQVTEAEEAWGWFGLVDDEDERRALAAWVRCMADHKRLFFKDWCLRVGIHPQTGRRRKNSAIRRIYAQLSRNAVQHCKTSASGVLPEPPQIGDIPATVEDEAHGETYSLSWMDDQAFQPFIINIGCVRHINRVDNPGDFSWAAKRNEMRRKKAARKRQQEEQRQAG